MDGTEFIINQMEQDFEAFAEEHEAAASNEYYWSLGSKTEEDRNMHFGNMMRHRAIAKMYRKMKADALAFVETYEED